MNSAIESAVAERIAEIDSMLSKWTYSQWRKPKKSSRPVSRDDLNLLYLTTHLAYEKELTHIPSAYRLHVAVERGWTKFEKAAFIISDLRGVQLSGDEIKVRAALHMERVKTLANFLSEDPTALRVPMPIHPSLELATRGISDELRTHSSIGDPGNRSEDIACLMLRELESPGQLTSSGSRYSDGLPQGLPLQQYAIVRKGEFSPYFVHLVGDDVKSPRHTVMALQTSHTYGRWPQPMTHAYVYRAAEFPVPSMGIKPFGIQQTKGTTGLFTQIFGFNKPMTITERPDVLGEVKWNTRRRFSFGGRKFVWKPTNASSKKKSTIVEDFDVFEYTETAPVDPGDPNKVADDASSKILSTQKEGTRIVCVGGLDPVLKDYLIANVVLRLAIRAFTIVAAGHEERNDATMAAKMSASWIAHGGITLLQVLLS